MTPLVFLSYFIYGSEIFFVSPRPHTMVLDEQYVEIKVADNLEVIKVVFTVDGKIKKIWRTPPYQGTFYFKDINPKVFEAKVYSSQGEYETTLALKSLGFLVEVQVKKKPVFVSVRDRKGQFISGLTKENFQCQFDDIQKFPIKVLESVDKLEVLALVDVSNSMTNQIPTLKKTLLHLSNVIYDKDRLAIYGFNTSLRLFQDFQTKEISNIQNLDLQPSGGTALYDSAIRAIDQFQPNQNCKILIILTDGVDNESKTTPFELEQTLIANNVLLYLFYPYQYQKELLTLEKLSMEQGGFCSSFHQLNETEVLFQEAIDFAHQQYTLLFEPRNTAEKKTKLEIKLLNSSGKLFFPKFIFY